MSSDNDFCVKVSERRSDYESQQLTEKSLINLGKSLGSRENKQMEKERKYRFLVAFLDDINQDLEEIETGSTTTTTENRRLSRDHFLKLNQKIDTLQKLAKISIEKSSAFVIKIKQQQEEEKLTQEEIDHHINSLDERDREIEIHENTQRILVKKVDEMKYQLEKEKQKKCSYVKMFISSLFINIVLAAITVKTVFPEI